MIFKRIKEAEGAAALASEVKVKQNEIDSLQEKLTALHEKYDNQQTHYAERKERTKAKLQKAR